MVNDPSAGELVLMSSYVTFLSNAVTAVGVALPLNDTTRLFPPAPPVTVPIFTPP